MAILFRLGILAAVLLISASPCAQELFRLREMDMHLHAGMEREVDMKTWIDLAVADGRKVILLLDHLELYRKSQAEYDAWRDKGRFHALYPLGTAGHKALFDDFDAVRKRGDVLIFKGWEVYEGELDTGPEMAPLEKAEVIGWHISPSHGRTPPDGRLLIKRAKQVKELQKRLPVPMILFHPFPMRIEHLKRAAQNQARDPEGIRAEEYLFFQPGEQEELCRLLKGSSIYIEIGRDTGNYFRDPACRQALIQDIRPLAEAGAQFTVSTDNHGLSAAKRPWDPESYCEPIGVTPLNTNGLIRELRSKR